MSDRIKGFEVTLKNDVSEECAKNIQLAIVMIAHVANVREILALPFEDHIIENRVRIDLAMKIREIILPK